jgi:outer membrane protein OmpA-like peptidoglycan-associated protein
MRHLVTLTLATMALAASAPAHARPDPDAGHDFLLHNSGDAAKSAHGAHASKIEPTKGDAAMKFIVIDQDKGPVKGVVISLTAETGTKFYTEETDAEGYAEVLVPVGQKYDVTYLSLARREVAATVTVTKEPKQSVKLTLRYKRQPPPPPFVLNGIVFDTGRATIRPESFPRLDIIVDYMTHKKSARLEISGHTDNVGKPKANKVLSQKRAQACRTYIISKGVDASHLSAAGFGDERPIAPNDSDENRQKNRRIEAKELVTEDSGREAASPR